jgi:hypothetical protein
MALHLVQLHLSVFGSPVAKDRLAGCGRLTYSVTSSEKLSNAYNSKVVWRCIDFLHLRLQGLDWLIFTLFNMVRFSITWCYARKMFLSFKGLPQV